MREDILCPSYRTDGDTVQSFPAFQTGNPNESFVKSERDARFP